MIYLNKAINNTIGKISLKTDKNIENLNLKKIDDISVYGLVQNSEYEERAFKELYYRYSNKLFAYCRRIISDISAAEDIFQEAFIALLNNAKAGKKITSVPAYLIAVTRNLSLNYKRNHNKQFIDIDSLELGNYDKMYEDKEISELINRALELLPENYREAIVLYNYMGISYEEIAEIKNCSINNIKTWISRGKQKLKEILQPYFEYK